ncbi:hypothetical protein [Staphylococcus cornubiensis]|nr:hypothetical protein [Staphylococcus cornubiensis]
MFQYKIGPLNIKIKLTTKALKERVKDIAIWSIIFLVVAYLRKRNK